MAKIPVGDTINYAYTYTFGNLLPILGLTWLPLAISAGIGYYLQILVFDWLAKHPLFGAAGKPDTQAVMNAFSDMGMFMGLGFLITLVSVFLTAIVAVAVTTHSLGMRPGQKFVHFAAGAPEWRVFWGYIRLFFCSLGIMLIAGIGVALSVVAGQAISGGEGGGVGGIVAVVLVIVVLCLAVLTLVRMSYLIVPSIVMEPGKGGIARSYHLTGGNFWRIIIITLVLVLPVAMVAGAIQGAVIGNSFFDIFADMQQQTQSGGTPGPEQMQAMFARMIEKFRENFLPATIINFVSSIFFAGLLYGGTAYAYRALTGTPDAAAAPVPAA
jgi:hypothetical protein